MLQFHIDCGYWEGFPDLFAGEGEIHRVKPINIKYDLQYYDDGSSAWIDIEKNRIVRNEKITFKGKEYNNCGGTIEKDLGELFNSKAVAALKKYRMVIQEVEISYFDKAGSDLLNYKTKKIGRLRVPFKWSSFIAGSDLTEDSVYNNIAQTYEHNIPIVENSIIKKSVSFPEDGVTRLGKFSFIKKIGYGSESYINLPCERLYLFDLKYDLTASYYDPINRGGISKVLVTDHGANYRTDPTVTITDPTGRDDFKAAQVRPIMEGGRLKHIEIINSGSNYADFDEARRERVEQFRSDITPLLLHRLKITQLSGDQKARSLDYIPIGNAPLLKLYEVKITSNDASLEDEPQEDFGLNYFQSESMAKYNNPKSKGQDFSSMNKSVNAAKVEFMKGQTDDSNWGDIASQAGRIQAINNFTNKAIGQTKEVAGHGSYASEEEDFTGTENEHVDGFYEENERDASLVAERSVGIRYPDGTNAELGSVTSFKVYETYPPVENAVAWAIANNSSIAEYRVVDNKLALSGNPWISSFSRKQNPSLPKSFGIMPGTEVTSEVFNTYARAVNELRRSITWIPLEAKIRRYKQVEYRYINNPDMAGLTFPDKVNAGWNQSGSDYSTYEDKSRINYIVYIDPDENKLKVAHFSAFEAENGGLGKTKEGKAVVDENITDYDEDDLSPIWDDVEEELKDEPEGRKFKRQFGTDDPNKVPMSAGFPSTVNIPSELGIYCSSPERMDTVGTHKLLKGEGIPLPSPTEPRAYAYGGELVYTGPAYDVTDDQSPLSFNGGAQGNISAETFETPPRAEDGRFLNVDIRFSDHIKAGCVSQIVFGCQSKDKPFFSAFLRTVKVWTEYQLVPSASFLASLPQIMRRRLKRNIYQEMRCRFRSKRVTCSEEKIGTVDKSLGYHSLCSDGAAGTYNLQHSYESVFGLNEGDDVIGPLEKINEGGGQVVADGGGVFRVEPRFDLAMAVYGANETILAVRKGVHDPNGYIGPCIHYCMPGEIHSLIPQGDPVVLDYMDSGGGFGGKKMAAKLSPDGYNNKGEPVWKNSAGVYTTSQRGGKDVVFDEIF